MKQKLLKLVAAMLLGVFFSTTHAQKTMDVSGFTREDADLMARVTKPVRDKDEGKLCALIRVETGLKDLDVRADALGIVQKEEHNGEVWLYVPYGAKSLSFSHEGYFSLLYQYSMPIEEGVVYKLQLKAYDNPPAQGTTTQTQMFVLTHNPQEATVIIDDMEVPTENGVFAAMMSKGEHNYKVKAPKYEEKESVFVLGDQPIRENVKLEPLFGMFALFTLPDNNFDVFINGQLAGTSPYKSEQLDPGSYKVHVAKKNYYPVDTVFRLREGDSQIHTIKLTSKDDSLFYNRILGGRDISFGVNVGYVIPIVSASSGGAFTGSVMNYSLGNERENASYTSQSGFTAGVFADIRLYKNLYLITGINYTMYKYKNVFDTPFDNRIYRTIGNSVYYTDVYNNNYEEKYSYHQLEIPVLASYRFVLTKTGSLHLNLGPYFSYGLSAKMDLSGSSEVNGRIYYKDYDNTIHYETVLGDFSYSDHVSGEINMFKRTQSYTKTSESGSNIANNFGYEGSFEKSPFKRFNYGLKIGVTYELRAFQIGLNYSLQLSNMANDEFWESTRIPMFYQTGDNAMSGYKHRHHALEIKFGYVFRY